MTIRTCSTFISVAPRSATNWGLSELAPAPLPKVVMETMAVFKSVYMYTAEWSEQCKSACMYTAEWSEHCKSACMYTAEWSEHCKSVSMYTTKWSEQCLMSTVSFNGEGNAQSGPARRRLRGTSQQCAVSKLLCAAALLLCCCSLYIVLFTAGTALG